MSKQVTNSYLIPFALVAWREADNFRRNYGDDFTNLRNSLAERQWVEQNPVPAFPITEDRLAAEMDERQKKWDALKVLSTPEAATERAVFELLYCKDGKLVKPIYSGNAGFRRARTMFSAMVQRFRDAAKVSQDHGITGLVPIILKEYANRVDQIIDQQLENEMQGVGTKKMEDLEKLAVTHDLFKGGCRESEIRRLYKSSTGQKCYGICQADYNWPELLIFDRFYLPAESPDFIRWGPIRHNEIGKLNQRFDADKRRKDNLPMTADQKGLEPITADQVEQFFRDKSKGDGDGNAPKIMKKTDIETGAKSHQVRMFADVFNSILNDTQGNLAKYVERKEGLNAIHAMIDGGNGAAVETVAVSMRDKGTDIYVTVATLLAAGRADDVRKALASLTAPVVLIDPPAPASNPVPDKGTTPTPEAKVENPPKTPVPVPTVNAGKGGKSTAKS